ncbi:hypothetical protein VTN31DRAFT_4672 [Thermomyces dupontii]|uniref:uncharacterized protein n=1 Tax=Talaromyces thermophilus TaxID=28565 RepID=UPI0037427259
MRTMRIVSRAPANRLVWGTPAGLSTVPRLSRRSFPADNVSALAILLPRQHRTYATTEPSTSTPSGTPFPPPGFNPEQAKKPLSDTTPPRSSEPSSPSTAAKQDKPVQDAAPANATPSDAEAGPKDKSHELTPGEKQIVEPKETKKMTIGQKIKHEIQHYWDGTKLLATEVRISTKLAMKMAAGYELSRRESRQLRRTVKDLARLVPFSVFVIVPFAELLLPVALRLFPNLLPSTYEGQKSREAKAASLRSTRTEVSQFLRDTLKESGLPVSAVGAKKEEFTEFFRKVRATGETPSDEDVIKVCKIFKDDLTLDNLSRPQLVAICKYMNLNRFGTDAMLRYHIRHRMRQIKRDDRAIYYEGVESLSVPELQMACASRGISTHGVSPARLRDELSAWLELRLRKGVPSTLLVLSNAYMYNDGDASSQIDALRSVLSSIPEELFHEIELEVHNAEGAATNKQRLEVVKEQQELIEEENQQNKSHSTEGVPTPKDTENIDDQEQRSETSSGHEQQAAEATEAEQDEKKAEEQRSSDEEKSAR